MPLKRSEKQSDVKRIVLDTNVLISGLFFGEGAPRTIIRQCEKGLIELVLSRDIYDEYVRVIERLTTGYSEEELLELFRRITRYSLIVEDVPTFSEPISRDLDDDKFFACAVHAGIHIIVSGDRDLLDIADFKGVRVVTPRQFCDDYVV